MIRLSVEAINAKASYQVVEDARNGIFRFYSDYGVSFAVSFERDELMISGESYQFSITNLEDKPSPRDTKVKDTVMAIVEEFFKKNNVALLYICETGDSKQSMRSRLFNYWFASYKNHVDYLLIPMTVEEQEGVVNFAAMIIRRDNPNFNNLVSEFVNTINMFNEKPER